MILIFFLQAAYQAAYLISFDFIPKSRKISKCNKVGDNEHTEDKRSRNQYKRYEKLSPKSDSHYTRQFVL